MSVLPSANLHDVRLMSVTQFDGYSRLAQVLRLEKQYAGAMLSASITGSTVALDRLQAEMLTLSIGLDISDELTERIQTKMATQRQFGATDGVVPDYVLDGMGITKSE